MPSLSALIWVAISFFSLSVAETWAHANTPPPSLNQQQQVHHTGHAQRAQKVERAAARAHAATQDRAFATKEDLDPEHIKSHLDGKIDTQQEMTDEQLQFHYFKMYDTDNDGRLDGIELLKAITHSHQEVAEATQQGQPEGEQTQGQAPPQVPSEAELETTVDQVLQEYDMDGDGYIDYSEFSKAVGKENNNANNA